MSPPELHQVAVFEESMQRRCLQGNRPLPHTSTFAHPRPPQHPQVEHLAVVVENMQRHRLQAYLLGVFHHKALPFSLPRPQERTPVAEANVMASADGRVDKLAADVVLVLRCRVAGEVGWEAGT